MKKIFFVSLLIIAASQLFAQINIGNGWKFNKGDNPQWANANFNDAGWKPIAVGHPWEEEGYKDYDGYGWYRLHITIPSSLKDASYLTGGLQINLGKIDDGDEVFLNGKLIGENAGKTKDITKGPYDIERIYTIPLNDPAIHWNQENVIAVRVYDHGGGGGMYAGNYVIKIAGITDFITIDYQTNSFHFLNNNQLSKSILLKSSSAAYNFKGSLHIAVSDPATQKIVWQKTIAVNNFSYAQPFKYAYSFALPEQKSYFVNYVFTDGHYKKSVSAQEGVPYILTPKPSSQPKINGATVVGLRPDHPFIFKVPVTGITPIKYAADNLPEGLKINSETGIISGKILQKGTYTVHLTATNKAGKDVRDLKIIAGNQIALTPAMGWNSWNCWGLSVSDAKVRAAADAMRKSGLINHGWTYINIDDGWERPTRAADGEIVANEKFPDMKKMTDYVHGLGLKVGIYSSPGPKTCGGFTGSYQHEDQDAATYAKWGIDYLKYDWCSYGQIYPHPTLEALQKPYKVMRASLNKINRDILFSLCQYGMGDVWKWGGEIGGNSWRTTGDINDSWRSMSQIGFHQQKAAPYSKPGNWNDPDMLVVGKVGWGPALHNTKLTPDEQYTHISLWCLLSAPLLIGCDMSQLDDFTINLLSNDEVLALDQDPLGKEATQIAKHDSILIYEKDLADGNKAIGIFNTGDQTTDATITFADLKLNGPQQLRDLWRQKDLGIFENSFTAKNIPVHGVILLKAIRK